MTVQFVCRPCMQVVNHEVEIVFGDLYLAICPNCLTFILKVYQQRQYLLTGG
jgi:hypothetical protein